MKNNFKENFKDSPILITGHVNPDGDAIGSALALKLLLDSLHIESTVAFDVTGELPSNLNHLPYDLIGTPTQDSYKTVFVFDCGNSSRLGSLESIVLNSDKIVVVDHHIDPTFGDLQIIDPKAASTTQVLYRVFMEENIHITKEMADCLMTGLITDTGRFQYSNTDSEVFSIAADLMTKGSELSTISENIYGSIELNALKLQSKVIERLELDWEDACLSPQDNNRSVRTASQQQIRQKVFTGSSHAWRKFEPYLNGALDELLTYYAPLFI